MRIYRIAQSTDTLAEYLEFESEFMDKQTLVSIIQRLKLVTEDYGFAIKVIEGGKDYWFVFDQSDSMYNLTDIYEWIESTDEEELLTLLGLEYGDIYIGDAGYLKDIRENPGTAYHYTSEDGWSSIQSDGFIKQSHGTGLNNRGEFGLFVSMNPEEYADGTYGNVLLTIDLEKFKTESGIPSLNINIEPPVMDSIIRDSMSHKLGIERRTEYPTDYSINTLIVRHNIPLRYVTATL